MPAGQLAAPGATVPGTAPGGLLPAAYRQALAEALRRHLRYPQAARDMGLEGEVLLRFHLTRGGQLRGAEVVRSSGVTAFDAEALALLARITPFMPLPADWPAEEAAFTAPIRFVLR